MTSKERPIILSAHAVRAILDGSKTQTRLPLKLRNGNPNAASEWHAPRGDHETLWVADGVGHVHCPCGRPGDRLWVREAWKREVRNDGVVVVRYSANRAVSEPASGTREQHLAGLSNRWRPSIYMPRWASRLTLEVTDVRVERLQMITDADAIAEGHEATPFVIATGRWCGPVDRFVTLWESFNGPDSWDANPWVWVITFRRVDDVD